MVTKNITVASDNFLFLGIPDDQLLIRSLWIDIEFVDVGFLPGTTSGTTERKLADTPDFLHQVWSRMSIEGIYFITAFIRLPHKMFFSQLGDKLLFLDRVNDRLHFFTI